MFLAVFLKKLYDLPKGRWSLIKSNSVGIMLKKTFPGREVRGRRVRGSRLHFSWISHRKLSSLPPHSSNAPWPPGRHKGWPRSMQCIAVKRRRVNILKMVHLICAFPLRSRPASLWSSGFTWWSSQLSWLDDIHSIYFNCKSSFVSFVQYCVQ